MSATGTTPSARPGPDRRLLHATAVLAAAGLFGMVVLLSWEVPALWSALVPAERAARLGRIASVWPAALAATVVAAVGLAAVFLGRGGWVACGSGVGLICGVPLAWLNLAPGGAGVGPAMLVCWTLGPAAWLWGLWQALGCAGDPPAWRPRAAVATAFALYVGVFATLSLLQYRALMVPHGDTGMYEEHLVNLTRGRGLRSELDDGRSFLGEHFQVVHVLLLPVYRLWPSLTTLNVLQCLALGSCGPVTYLIARRLALGRSAAAALATAVLLYFPLQLLNLEASGKTLRPTSFGVGCVMLALWCLESRRFAGMALLLALSVTAKEEYALLAAAVGTYLLVRRDRNGGDRARWWGLGVTLGALAALAAIVGWAIPHFRAGAPPHYMPYFGDLGATPGDVVRRALTDPLDILRRYGQVRNLRFLVLMLGPLSLAPLFSPLRLAVAAPIAGYLMLADAGHSFLVEPQFHFHAPLLAVLFWATCGGVANLSRLTGAAPWPLARWVCCLCLVGGVWLGRSPLSWRFHDPVAGVRHGTDPGGLPTFEPRADYWRDLYLPTDRSRAFDEIDALIPHSDTVAATDYVRSRFVRHAAAYDYSSQRSHVSAADYDWIVLDKTEGWWGREAAGNRHRQLLAAMRAGGAAEGRRVQVDGIAFGIVRNGPYFLVARRLP